MLLARLRPAKCRSTGPRLSERRKRAVGGRGALSELRGVQVDELENAVRDECVGNDALSDADAEPGEQLLVDRKEVALGDVGVERLQRSSIAAAHTREEEQ